MSPERRTDSAAERLAMLAVDTGGTFTDLVLLLGGGIETLKVPSTPEDPSEAVLRGLGRLLEVSGLEEIPLLLHGSTVATNALLERKGARVALITNRGFEDFIEIGRQNRPQLYALVGHRPPPLVDRGDRIGIAGRLGPRGKEIEPLDEAELTALRGRLAGEGFDSIAVVLLHSYTSGDHEERVAEKVAPPGLPVSVSSELLPEFREYERGSTTVVNAYVAPKMSRYLRRIEAEGATGAVRVMGSNGGSLPLDRAIRHPVHTVLSGPTGGVVGALEWARRCGIDRIISFDMGGTSTDVGLSPGEILHTRDFQIAGQPVAIPVVDIHTVGAGGGSIARADMGGALKVGPESAGADPGPICYGRGGEGVTVTDANLWLGRLQPDSLLGGGKILDREAVAPHLGALAEELGGSLEETASGILSVVNVSMEGALRVISVERGFDPRDFVLVAFGGAGGLHAAALAAGLGVAHVLIPPDPGLLSAYGMLAAPVTHEASRTVLVSTGDPEGGAHMDEVFRSLEEEVRGRVASDRDHDATPAIEHTIDARYEGQSFELRVKREGWEEAFHQSHEQRYGYARRDTPLEAVTLRVTGRIPGPPLPHSPLPSASAPPMTEDLRLYAAGEMIRGKRVSRSALHAGHELAGPLIVREYSSTAWVPPDWTVRVDRWGSLHLRPHS